MDLVEGYFGLLLIMPQVTPKQGASDKGIDRRSLSKACKDFSHKTRTVTIIQISGCRDPIMHILFNKFSVL